MEWLMSTISGLFLFVGCFFIVTGAWGIVRMPDIYTRIHAASVIDTGGVIFIIVGLLIHSLFVAQTPMATIKLVLLMFFINFSAPTASHAIAKMALKTGVIPQSKAGGSAIDPSLKLFNDNAEVKKHSGGES